MLARLLVLTIHTGWADSPIVQMVLFAIALRHGDITIQHTGRNSTQADTAHRQVQHSHTCTHIYALRFLSLTETLGANLSPTTSDASESS